MKILKLKIPPVIVFLFALLLIWLTKEFFPSPAVPELPEWPAYLVAGIGFLLGVAGIIEFRRAATTVNPHQPDKSTNLVSSGPYKISRNPMYLALLCALLAAGIWWNEPFSLPVIIGFIAFMNHFQIIPEERVLEEKFSEEYIQYKSRVRRWI